MKNNNIELYETDEVVNKYASNTTRVRCLNEAEKMLIDQFDVKYKTILVLGSGAGRVPSNLILFGNRVLGLELSSKLNKIANDNFPHKEFTRLTLEQGDATDLKYISDNAFDVVFFPQMGIDLIYPLELREKAISEMAKKVKKGGLLIIASHNKIAYHLSYKISNNNRIFNKFLLPFIYKKENVVGGGYLFKGNPKYIIKQIEDNARFKFIGFACERRSKIDKILAKKFSTAKYIFPYFIFVFRNI